jgi:hypothetical protein
MKCPYVPPHSLNIDFPQLMLRYRAVEQEEANRTTKVANLNPPLKPFERITHEEKQIVQPNVSRDLHLEKQSMWTLSLPDLIDDMNIRALSLIIIIMLISKRFGSNIIEFNRLDRKTRK